MRTDPPPTQPRYLARKFFLEDVELWRSQRASGWTCQRIAEVAGLAVGTVCSALRGTYPRTILPRAAAKERPRRPRPALADSPPTRPPKPNPGCCSLNAKAAALRCQPADVARWRQLQNEGWSHDQIAALAQVPTNTVRQLLTDPSWVAQATPMGGMRLIR